MMFFGIKLIIVISNLTNIGILCRCVYCLDESSREKGYNNNLGRDRINVDQVTKVSQDTMGMFDKNDKLDLLNQHLDDASELETPKNAEFPSFKISPNAPYTTPEYRANLQSKTNFSKPSYKNSEKRKRLSKNSTSKSKPINDTVNNKVMTLDCGCQGLPSVQRLQQETEVGLNENPCRSCNVNREKLQKASNNYIYNANKNGQNLINKDINGYLKAITDSVDLAQDADSIKYFLPNILLPTDRTEFTQKDKNEIENRTISFLPVGFNEALQEQNIILKELLSKIVNLDNVTGKAANEANTRRVHVIVDINNIGSKNFDLELNPTFKFRDEYDQSNSNVAFADDKNLAKVYRESNGEMNVRTFEPENFLSYITHNNYVPFQYSNRVVEVPTQTPVLNLNESGKNAWNYGCNSNRQHIVTPQMTNEVYLSTKDQTRTSSTIDDIAIAFPQHNYYNGYIHSMIPQLYSKSDNKYYQNPLYSYYGLQSKLV